MTSHDLIQNSIDRALSFVSRLEKGNEFLLFERSESSPYARCFVIFIRALCRDSDWLEANGHVLTEQLNSSFLKFYRNRQTEVEDIKFDKPVLQLLCFTLSALHITGGQLSAENIGIIEDYISSNLEDDLRQRGVFSGSPGSGNYAMFRAVLLIFARDQLELEVDDQIAKWIDLHLDSMNKNGFWGDDKSMQFLQFQNGYHQYEILETLQIDSAPWSVAARQTALLADKLGHFAPYPGGGGCYDYDAIFMLTSRFSGDCEQAPTVRRTLQTILGEQNDDGGFCESRLIRSKNGLPRPLALFLHVLNQPPHTRVSSTLTGLNLFRPKHSRVRTHWCSTDRRWNESNAWDTYFRLQLIARATKFLDLSGSDLFEMSEYPGIG